MIVYLNTNPQHVTGIICIIVASILFAMHTNIPIGLGIFILGLILTNVEIEYV